MNSEHLYQTLAKLGSIGPQCAAIVILSEAAMSYLANSLAALSILSLVVFIGSLFALFVKSARQRAKWLAVGGFVGFFAAGFASLPFSERAAHEAGYSDYASQMRAEHLVDEAAERKRSEEAERKAAADKRPSANAPSRQREKLRPT